MLPFSVVLLQEIHCYPIELFRYYGNAASHCYAKGTVTLLWKCNKLIITQQELLRYHGNAIWCIAHVTKENLICHII
jgi:hypothetical protein